MPDAPYIHESSYIDDNVVIGAGTKVWHFCHIQEGASLGENCSLGQNVNIGPNVKIGNGVRIQNNVSVYEGVEIEDNVFLGPSCVFTNVTSARWCVREPRWAPTALLSVDTPLAVTPWWEPVPW